VSQAATGNAVKLVQTMNIIQQHCRTIKKRQHPPFYFWTIKNKPFSPSKLNLISG